MTCNGVLNRTRTVDGKLVCAVTGRFSQVTLNLAVVPDPTKVCVCARVCVWGGALMR